MKHKKLKITLSVIVGIAVLLFAAYKLSYNTLAPMVFDFIVGKNPETLLKLEEMEIEETEEVTEEEPAKEEETEVEKEPEQKPAETKKSTQENQVYSSETDIGILTTNDLAHVIKVISPADKTRIITICKSVVSASDMPRFARMATQGMQGDDYAFTESYLRARLSAAQKIEILNIVRKYLGR